MKQRNGCRAARVVERAAKRGCAITFSAVRARDWAADAMRAAERAGVGGVRRRARAADARAEALQRSVLRGRRQDAGRHEGVQRLPARATVRAAVRAAAAGAGASAGAEADDAGCPDRIGRRRAAVAAAAGDRGRSSSDRRHCVDRVAPSGYPG